MQSPHRARADYWPDDVRLSDIEPNFVCTRKNGAEVRPKSMLLTGKSRWKCCCWSPSRS